MGGVEGEGEREVGRGMGGGGYLAGSGGGEKVDGKTCLPVCRDPHRTADVCLDTQTYLPSELL